MLNFRQDEAAAVAENTRAALATCDDALGAVANLTLVFLEAARDSRMTAGDSQKVVQKIHESAGGILAGRAGMVSAVGLLTSLQRRSNQAETSFGCPGPMPWDLTGSDRRLRVVSAA